MATTATERDRGKQRAPGVDAFLIDTDVHESMRSPLDLKPYLEPVWQQYWERVPQVRLPMAILPYAIPAHVPARQDWKLEDGSFAADVEVSARHLFEEMGVSIAILNNFTHLATMPTSPEYGAAIARAYTQWQIEHWLDKDPRFRGSVYVLAHDPAAAAAEIDRVAAHPQVVQVFLPLVTDVEYGDPMYRPIFEAAIRNGLVVAFHHGGYTTGQVGRRGWPRYFIEWHNTAQIHATQNQLTSLVCNGLFDRYPDLKVVFLEAGVGWVTPFILRFDQQYRELRSEIPWVKQLPSEHILSHVRFSTQPMADVTPAVFKELIEMGGTERLFMYSSDYPHYDADNPETALRSLPDGLRQRIRYQNATETYPRLAGLAA